MRLNGKVSASVDMVSRVPHDSIIGALSLHNIVSNIGGTILWVMQMILGSYAVISQLLPRPQVM